MVENRVRSFFLQLKYWVQEHPGYVAISCHNNSVRIFRRVFEKLTAPQMCRIKTPRDWILIYDLDLYIRIFETKSKPLTWVGKLISKEVRFFTDPKNQLKKYYFWNVKLIFFYGKFALMLSILLYFMVSLIMDKADCSPIL